MLNVKTKGLKLITLICGFAACVAVLLGMAAAKPTGRVYGADATVDSLGVAFKKVNVGDSLAAAFDFDDETAKTLKGRKLYGNARIRIKKRASDDVVGRRQSVLPVEQS